MKVKSLFGVYGKERDEWIQRSHLVINHHYFESEIFEVVRVFYLLTNSVAVVGEVNSSTSIDDVYRTAIYEARYEDLVDACVKLLSESSLRLKVEEKAYEAISKHPQTAYMREILQM